MNSIGGKAAIKGEAEARVARELDDFARARDSRPVNMSEANDGAVDPVGAGPPGGVALDIKLRAPVLAARMGAATLVFFVLVRFDQLTVDGNGAEVDEPAQRLRLKQAIHQGAVSCVRLARNPRGRFNGAIDDHVAVVEQVRFAALRRERADADVAIGNGSVAERGTKPVAHGGDDPPSATVKVA
jgi:hypothetical protein